MNPLLSIVTITYNSEKIIRPCLKSILSQKLDRVEYVVVDGLSTDGTMRILNEHKSQIDVLISEKDKGIYNAMNKAWKLCSGRFVLFINSDDKLCDGAANLIIEAINKMTFEEMIVAPVLGFDGRNEVLIKPVLRKRNSEYFTMPVCHQGLVMKKSLLEKFNGFDESYKILADFDLLMKVLNEKIGLVQLDEPIAIYSLGGASSGISHLKEYSRLYKAHRFPFIKSKLYVLYIWLSYHLQRLLPWKIISLIKKFKKSRFQNIRSN